MLRGVDTQIAECLEDFKKLTDSMTLTQHLGEIERYTLLVRDALSPREPTTAGIRLAAECASRALWHIGVIKERVG